MANNENIIRLIGRIDTNNALEWEQKIKEQLNSDAENVFDADELEYISSAGLRVLMKIRKMISGEMRIYNVSSEVYDIFDVTGFT